MKGFWREFLEIAVFSTCLFALVAGFIFAAEEFNFAGVAVYCIALIAIWVGIYLYGKKK